MASCVAQFNKITIQKEFKRYIPFDIWIKYNASYSIFPKFTLSYT